MTRPAFCHDLPSKKIILKKSKKNRIFANSKYSLFQPFSWAKQLKIRNLQKTIHVR